VKASKVYLCRSGSYWVGRWKGGSKGLGRREDAGGLVTDLAARMICAKLQLDLEAGARVARTPNISQWCSAFISLRPWLAEASVKLYNACGDRLVRFLGAGTLLSTVTPLDAEKFTAWLTASEGLEAGSVKRIVREARTIFGKAEELGIIQTSPFRHTKGPKAVVNRSWSDVPMPTTEKLLGVAVGPWRGLLGLCRLAGLRMNEALALKWSDVDLVARRLKVVKPGRYDDTKHRDRDVPIVPRLHDVLFALSMEAAGADRVCEGVRSPCRVFKMLCAQAGVQPWSAPYQTCRKAREKEWVKELGLDVATEFLGNSAAVAMRHYLKADDADFDRAAGVKEEAIR
jgi:integrase